MKNECTIKIPIAYFNGKFYVELTSIFEAFEAIGHGMQQFVPGYPNPYLVEPYKTNQSNAAKSVLAPFKKCFVPYEDAHKWILTAFGRCEDPSLYVLDMVNGMAGRVKELQMHARRSKQLAKDDSLGDGDIVRSANDAM